MSKKTKKRKTGFRFFLLSIIIMGVSVVFWSTSSLLIIGMMPTLVYWLIDKSFQKNKTLTIGAMNFAGCFPFLVDIWKSTHPSELSITYLTDPLTIIVIYSAALFGYGINYLTVMTVSSYMQEAAVKKIEWIENEKKVLEKRWGSKVNGETVLDERGFPLDKETKSSDDEQDVQK